MSGDCSMNKIINLPGHQLKKGVVVNHVFFSRHYKNRNSKVQQELHMLAICRASIIHKKNEYKHTSKVGKCTCTVCFSCHNKST